MSVSFFLLWSYYTSSTGYPSSIKTFHHQTIKEKHLTVIKFRKRWCFLFYSHQGFSRQITKRETPLNDGIWEVFYLETLHDKFEPEVGYITRGMQSTPNIFR